MSFGDSVRSVYTNYANFSGRASRSEFWKFQAFIVLVYLGMFLGVAMLPRGLTATLFIGFYGWALLTLVPEWALAVRRLHDIDRSGLWLFALLFPTLGTLLLALFWCTASNPITNEWGPPAGHPSTIYYYPPASGFTPGPYADTSHPLNFPPPPAAEIKPGGS